MGKPSAPPAPDYVGAAQAQGVANKDTAITNSSLGNPNVTNPYGSQTVSYTPTGPNGDMQPNVVQSLNPQAQQTLDAQQRVQTGLANLGEQGLAQARGVLGNQFNYNGPGIQTSLGQQPGLNYGPAAGQYGLAQGFDPGGYGQASGFGAGGQAQTSLGGYGQAQTSLGGYGQANAGPSAQGNLDLSGVAKMPVNAGTAGQAALMARLQPQMDQSDAALNQQLANQGLTAGGEAYNNAQRVQGQQDNDLKTQAALYGIGLDTQANAQGYGQALQSGQFGNQALGQNFAQNLGAQAQNYNQALGAGQFANQGNAQNYGQALGAAQFGNQALGQNFAQSAAANQSQNAAIAQNAGLGLQGTQTGNAAIGQNYGQGLAGAGLYNQAIGQGYNQNLGAAQFGNTAAAQSLQQQMGLYNQPLNQITALMSGSQIQAPQFQQYQGSSAQAAPLFQGTQAQGNYAQQSYAQQMAGYNSMMGAVGGLFGAAGAAAGGGFFG